MRRLHIPQPDLAVKARLLTVAMSLGLLVPGTMARQAKLYPLESAEGLRLHDLTAEPAVLQSKKGLRVWSHDR
jgi:hypothetical protein